jgi:hypothetical protein
MTQLIKLGQIDSISSLSAFTDTSLVSIALVAGGRYRFAARITAGTLPASPGPGGQPITIMTGIDSTTNYHTLTPNGAEAVRVNGIAVSPFLFSGAIGTIITLVPVTGGWEMGVYASGITATSAAGLAIILGV